ncbi:MAG: MarR family transcriptional regulator [Mycoplasmataceae bacterium]|jgi:DNA-binding MarR family transcriptional regulator|nr:MarR family transcriptional regulator [Mycoplasmataceae bacterium]
MMSHLKNYGKFRNLFRAFDKIKIAMHHQEFGGEFRMLHYLHHNGEVRIVPSQMSKHMHVSSARIAKLLNVSEKKGWITRVHDKTDRRLVFVSLTKAGEKESQRRGREMLQQLSKVIEKLGKKDVDEFIRILERVADIAYKEIEEGGRHV